MVNLNVLQAYINGEDTPGYNIDDLENNPQFMMAAINLANDVNFYRLCSDNVKTNYEFVKFLIKKLSEISNGDFYKSKDITVCSVANDFIKCKAKEINELVDEIHELELNYASSDILDEKNHQLFIAETQRLEIVIIVSDIVKNNPDYLNDFNFYQFLLTAKFDEILVNVKKIEFDLAHKNEFESIQNLAMGFILVIDKYGSSDIVVTYFARKFIISILKKSGFDFEKYIRERFNSFNEIEKIGINTYLLNFLSSYDKHLASYAARHLEVLDEITKELLTIKNRWDWFVSDNEEKKFDILLDAVHKYWEENVVSSNLEEFELLCLIGDELGVLDKILKYGYENIGGEDIISIDKLKLKNMNFADLKHYRDLKALMLQILNKKVAEEIDDDVYVEPVDAKENFSEKQIINISPYQSKN